MQKQIETTIRQDLENIWIYHSITKGNGFRILIFQRIEIFGELKFSGNRSLWQMEPSGASLFSHDRLIRGILIFGESIVEEK